MKGGIIMKKIALLLMMVVAFTAMTASYVWAADKEPYRVVNPPQISVPK